MSRTLGAQECSRKAERQGLHLLKLKEAAICRVKLKMHNVSAPEANDVYTDTPRLWNRTNIPRTAQRRGGEDAAGPPLPRRLPAPQPGLDPREPGAARPGPPRWSRALRLAALAGVAARARLQTPGRAPPRALPEPQNCKVATVRSTPAWEYSNACIFCFILGGKENRKRILS